MQWCGCRRYRWCAKCCNAHRSGIRLTPDTAARGAGTAEPDTALTTVGTLDRASEQRGRRRRDYFVVDAVVDGVTWISLFTEVTPATPLAIDSAFAFSSSLLAVPFSVTTPLLS